MQDPKFIIVVGTSAGGLQALTEFIAQLDEDMDIAVFIVMHLSRTGLSDFLVKQLQPLTNLQCQIATDNEKIRKGRVYISARNKHLLVKKGKIILGGGPEENRWRPSIDVLFRSAAASYSSSVIGIILTGLLDDGTTGMAVVKRCGGISIVQDPNEAEYPNMPMSVLNNMEVDHCISLSEMGDAITAILKTTPASVEVPEDVIIESEIAERVVVDFENIKKIGDQSIFACPDCGGGMWNMMKKKGDLDRYRCHIGHLYSENDLVVKQEEVLETTLWVALRIMEERKTLLKKMEGDHFKKGLKTTAKEYTEKIEVMEYHVDKMKEILFKTQKIM